MAPRTAYKYRPRRRSPIKKILDRVVHENRPRRSAADVVIEQDDRSWTLVRGDDGLWAIKCKRNRERQTLSSTGHVDYRLAELEFVARRDSGLPSIEAQNWLKVANRLAGNTRRSKRATDEYITRTDILRLLKKQDYRCAVSGSYFTHDAFEARSRDPFQPSVDRMDCSRGYELDNIRIVCLAVNIAMSDWGEAVLRKIAERIVAVNAPGLRPDDQILQPSDRPRLRLFSCEELDLGENKS